MRPLVPPYIESLKPYVPGKPIAEVQREYGIRDVVKLASNENPLGPSPLAVIAMKAAVEQVHLYPDASSFDLIHALSKFLGFPPSEIAVGSGSNELIELIIRTFTVPEDEALLSAGSFVMYKVALQAHGRSFVEVPMKAGFRYDLEAMAARISSRTRLIFLANPDNPTGTAFGRTELEAFLEKVPPDVLVVLDEAYFEFVRWSEYPNGLDYVRGMRNVIVLRTFSKIYGLAGIRLGYGVMDAELVGYLNRTRMPFDVTNIAQAAGIAALGDTAHRDRTCELNLAQVAYLEAELLRLGLSAPKSYTNFVFVDFQRAAKPLYQALLEKGVITRPVAAYGFPNALRISVGLPEQNERLVRTLGEIL